MKKQKIRPLGELITQLEELLDGFYIEHDMQHGDVLALIHGFSNSHYPDHREQYQDGTVPNYLYGHVDLFKKK